MACDAGRRALVWPRKVVVLASPISRLGCRCRGRDLSSRAHQVRPTALELGPGVDAGHARAPTSRRASDAHLGDRTRARGLPRRSRAQGASAREGVAGCVGLRSGISSQHVDEGGTLKRERRDPSPWASWEEPSSSSSSRWLSCSSSTGSSRRSTDSTSPLRDARPALAPLPPRLLPVPSSEA
jgi:hypothetical protein